MKYALLIYSDEDRDSYDRLPAEEREAIMGEYVAISQLPGAYGGEQLQPTATATTVRVRDGKTHSTDGPFAETREQLGGYYLIEAKDLDEATKVAARIPSVRFGSIEIRPVMTF